MGVCSESGRVSLAVCRSLSASMWMPVPVLGTVSCRACTGSRSSNPFDLTSMTATPTLISCLTTRRSAPWKPHWERCLAGVCVCVCVCMRVAALVYVCMCVVWCGRACAVWEYLYAAASQVASCSCQAPSVC